jgi:hypothetical protein
VLVLAATLALPSVYAGEGFRHQKEKRGLDAVFQKKVHVMLKNAGDIGLTPDKIEELKGLQLDTQKTLIQQKADMKVINLDIREKLRAPQVDVNEVYTLVDRKYEIKKTGDKMLVDAIVKTKGLLTQEQMDKLKELWKSGPETGRQSKWKHYRSQ